jgi:hypothetical protein
MHDLSPPLGRITIGVGDIAADKFTAELMGGMHDGKTTRSRIDDEVARASDGTDQAADEIDRLDVWVFRAIDLLRPLQIPWSRQVFFAASGGFCSTRR